MTLYEVAIIRDKRKIDSKTGQPAMSQEWYAVDDDTIGPVLKHLDTEIRSSNSVILGINSRLKITKHLQ